jgi:hypothetical protein
MVERLSLAGSRFPYVVFVVAGLTVFFAATACSRSESATSEETTDSQATSSSEATTAEGFAAEDQVENPLSAASGGETLTPVLVSIVGGDTAAVRGSDGRHYAVYELLLTNASSSSADLETVEVLDAADGTEVLKLEGQEMIEDQALLMLDLQPAEDASLEPSESRVLLLTASFESEEDVPDALDNQIEVSAPAYPGATEPSTLSYRAGGSVDLSRRTPPVLSPPLEGEGWVATNGCCEATSIHRKALLTVNGKLFDAQRFAIDWIRVDADGQAVTGDPSEVSNWVGYGAQVMAVADGVVVASLDDLENQTPGSLPDPSTINLKNIDGNYVVVDHGDGLYSFYAHLQPGSVAVEVGDEIRAGDRLGLLGNTGNTSAPHLHFHVIRGPSPVASDGFPYVFDSFLLAGTVDINASDSAPSRAELSPVAHERELPLDNTIVDFPSG